jgi:arginase family enzyme
MIDLMNYFDPLSIEEPPFPYFAEKARFSNNIAVHTENSPIKNLDKYKIALFGVPEGRNCPIPGTIKAPNCIRKQLYQLAKIPGKLKIIDLGDMRRGVSFEDTVAGLADILVYLSGKEIFPLILGGSSALALAIDKAMRMLKKRYTLATVDSRIDYAGSKDTPGSLSFLKDIIDGKNCMLGHFINIGYQTQLNDQQVVNRLKERHAELVRIGEARKSIHLTEPLIRDSDAIIFDMSSVRQSDAPGTISPSPNGFYGEEICLLARYAGISDNLSLFALFDVDPDVDFREQTTGLAAQVVWFFLEGFAQKQYEAQFLDVDNGRFTRYHVTLPDVGEDMVFVKSNFTDRWWIELINTSGESTFIACSQEDYMKANHGEVPERWLLGTRRG